MKRLVWKIVLAASLVLMVVASVNIVILSREYQKGINTYEKLGEYVTVAETSAETVVETSDETAQEPSETTEQEPEESKIEVALDIDVDALSKINEDFVGWIYYEPLELSYPIVRGTDNDYYTHYTFENEKNSSGAIFLDFLNKPDFSHFNTIIYGHNMRNGTMFGSLKKLLNDNTIVEEDPYLYVFTEDQVMMYEIFALYVTKDSSHTYDLTQTAEEQQQYVEYIKETADYYRELPELETPLAEKTKLVTLSTCHGKHGSGNRTVVHAVLIAQEDR